MEERFSSPTDTFFHKRYTQGKLLESVISWSPCHVRLGWRCCSEDNYTQLFHRSGKVCTMCVEHSSIPHLGSQLSLVRGWWKRSFYLFPYPKCESIRIILSDLDPQQVARRATGYFQPCFPARRTVKRPVSHLTVWMYPVVPLSLCISQTLDIRIYRTMDLLNNTLAPQAHYTFVCWVCLQT